MNGTFKLCVAYELCMLHCYHQARTICFHCADKVYRYQLTLKAVVFTIILMECITLVNEMLLMISGDIQPNPGPGECLYRAYYVSAPCLMRTACIRVT